jgi:hypothetical protein
MLSAIVGSPIYSCQLSHRHLRGQDQGAALVAVIADLQEVAALGIFQWRHGEVS